MASDVKWIKITTDIFDDEKIVLLESMPDSYALIVVWIKLLCFAGRLGTSGVLVMQNGVAYNTKMLASIFHMKETVVEVALKTFVDFGMITLVDDVITITNWGKHQTMDQLDAKREYMRDYMQKYRAKQKLLASKNNSEIYCKTNSEANFSCAEYKNIRIRDRYNIYPQFGDGVCAFDAPNGTPNVDNSASIDEQPAPMAALPEPKRKPRKKADRAETPDFIRFYTEYPRHEARAAAWEAWAKLDPSPELVETIIDHVKRRKTTAWRGVEKQHIPHPSTFINQRRWTDELPKRSGFSSQEIDY